MTAAIGFDFVEKVRFLVKCLSENYLSNLRNGFQTGILIGMVSGEVAYFSDRLKNFDMLCGAQVTRTIIKPQATRAYLKARHPTHAGYACLWRSI